LCVWYFLSNLDILAGVDFFGTVARAQTDIETFHRGDTDFYAVLKGVTIVVQGM